MVAIMSRRGFLKNASYGTGLLVTASLPFGLARLLTPEVVNAAEPHQRLRPPGALEDDNAFNEACIGCGLCGEVCPPHCIQFYKREGGNKVNTPFINPEQKACILCDKCMEVCPTDALKTLPRNDIKMGIAQIDRTACYPWVDRGICGACVAICPLGERAIKFRDWGQYRPIVTTECVGCGLCVEVCPHPSLPIRVVDSKLGTVTKHSL
jgi:formate hydrogenlyase subunit 6/NADH:ubiquinone oxidoreductase subunit I